jgi:hypothetical protein
LDRHNWIQEQALGRPKSSTRRLLATGKGADNVALSAGPGDSMSKPLLSEIETSGASKLQTLNGLSQPNLNLKICGNGAVDI